MPKDNEVDEKVIAMVCLVPSKRYPHFAGVEVQLYGGYEPRIGDEFYSAATVAELRAEVADLRARLVKQRRELGAEADQADAEAKRITEVAERAMNLLERLDPVEFQKFCKSEFNRLTGADPT